MSGNNKYKTLSNDAIIKALFENYESIYVVDAETSAFQCFHESDSYSSLRLEDHGDDFFDTTDNNVIKTVYPDDQEYVRGMISKDALSAGLKKKKFYSFVYRLIMDGKPLYHKLRATKEHVEGRPHFLIGIRNIDAAFRQGKAMAEKANLLNGTLSTWSP